MSEISALFYEDCLGSIGFYMDEDQLVALTFIVDLISQSVIHNGDIDMP